jgi:hypothetical protein
MTPTVDGCDPGTHCQRKLTLEGVKIQHIVKGGGALILSQEFQITVYLVHF